MLLVDAVASMFVYGAIAFFTGHEWLLAWRGGYMRRGMLEIPTTVLLSAIVVGAALVWIALIWQTIKALRQLATGIEEPTAATTPEVSI